MPEGPEIRFAADQLNAVLSGRTIERAEFTLPGMEQLGKSKAVKSLALPVMEKRCSLTLTMEKRYTLIINFTVCGESLKQAIIRKRIVNCV